MLGHLLVRELVESRFNSVYCTVYRSNSEANSKVIAFENVDIMDFEQVKSVIHEVAPDVIINCIGLIKQDKESENPKLAYPINSVFPNKLSVLCAYERIRLIHISSDCVFSGAKGSYSEDDTADPIDVYGTSKLLGEVNGPRDLVLRTSLIGPELNGKKYGLLEWFLSTKGECAGYKNAFFSGLTTLEFSKVISKIIIPNIELTGLYHIASEPISKFELLSKIAERYKQRVNIIPTDEPVINRALEANKFYIKTGYRAPSWESMIEDMYTNTHVFTRLNEHNG